MVSADAVAATSRRPWAGFQSLGSPGQSSSQQAPPPEDDGDSSDDGGNYTAFYRHFGM